MARVIAGPVKEGAAMAGPVRMGIALTAAAALLMGLGAGLMVPAPAEAASETQLRGYSIKTPERYRVPPDILPRGGGASLCVDPTKPTNARAGRFASIGEAVKHAGRNDVITIELGAAAENLVITKPLTLRGGSCEDDRAIIAWPTRDMPDKTYSFTSDLARPAIFSRNDLPCLVADTDGVVFLHGLRLATEGGSGNAEACVVQKRGWLRIADSLIGAGTGQTRAAAALQLANGNTRIEGNMILGGKVGISIGHGAGSVSEPVLVENTTVTRAGVGILVTGDAPVLLTRNLTAMGAKGVEWHGGGSLTMFGNYLADNLGPGLSLAGSGTYAVTYNTLIGNGGPVVEGAGSAGFRSNLLACNREAPGIDDDSHPTNVFRYNPIPQSGWFSKKPDPDATAWCLAIRSEYSSRLGLLGGFGRGGGLGSLGLGGS